MTTEEKKKSKEFLHRLHGKYYGKKKSKEPKVVAKTPKEEPKVEGLSRNALMLQAKAKGIKNFRILNKKELGEVLKEGTTKERINEIVTEAISRWKTGWGTSKQKTQK